MATCPFRLEQLETNEKVNVDLFENADNDLPKHRVGCTPHECHGSMMEKNGFEQVSNSYSTSNSEKTKEARAFLIQFAEETNTLTQEDFEERIADIEQDIMTYGTYKHTPEELEFGCRLAWRNSGRCIMRKVSFSLELQDCRDITTAQDCFDCLVEHLLFAANGGSIKPVISIFPPKPDRQSAPVRIWNRQLVGYAAYKRKDGSIMGDPVNLEFTAFCVDLGWEAPHEKSDFDVLPIVISDRNLGHDNPQLFQLPREAILEVHIEHPDHDLFSMLNMRWYAIPAISNMGVDIGGVYYQTCPFNGWYAITEIARDLLDRQRYDLAEAVAVACNISRTKMEVWRDDAQLQVHKAILHSFAKASVSVVDHHTASEAFMDFYTDEIAKRKKCPADWVWLVPPAGGSMTSVFHQEMLNFIVKPQYRPNTSLFEEQNIRLPEPLTVDIAGNAGKFQLDRNAVAYDKVRIYYGTETGTSLRFATRLAMDIDDTIESIMSVDELPNLFKSYISDRTLILVVTSTFGKGGPPSNATRFLPQMDRIQPGAVQNCDFSVFALGNAAYAKSYAAFGYELHEALERAGATPVLDVKVGDELRNQEGSFIEWRQDILGRDEGIIYGNIGQVDRGSNHQQENNSMKQRVNIKYQGFAQVIRTDTKKQLDTILKEQLSQSWSSYAYKLGRSTDLFSFQVPEDKKDVMRELRPGDHVALYPKNLDGTLDFTLGMLQLDGIESIKSFRDIIKSNVDLAKPVSLDALKELRDVTMSDQASFVLDMVISNESCPSVEALLSQLPPGSVPYEWILYDAPVMDPRFYSIASISHEDRSISICQSVYSFEATGQSGATSRWLRSLHAGDMAEAIFSTTDCHLPKDTNAPVLLIATGTGIAPFRSFWVSRVHNPMYLFFGCRNREELPFATEIYALARAKRMNPFIAYSRDPDNKLYVDDLLKQEAGIVLPLLHNPKTHIYFCGSPVVEQKVRNKLLMILCAGNDEHPGIEMSHAVEKLVIMKQQKRLIVEIYGTLEHEFDAMELHWQNATSKVVKALSNLEKMNLPRPRPEVMFEQIKIESKQSWSKEFRPDHSSKDKPSSTAKYLKMKKRGLDKPELLGRRSSASAIISARHSLVQPETSNSVPEKCDNDLESLSSVIKSEATPARETQDPEMKTQTLEVQSSITLSNESKTDSVCVEDDLNSDFVPLNKNKTATFKPRLSLRTQDSWQLTYNPKSSRKSSDQMSTSSHSSHWRNSHHASSLDLSGRSQDSRNHSAPRRNTYHGSSMDRSGRSQDSWFSRGMKEDPFSTEKGVTRKDRDSNRREMSSDEAKHTQDEQNGNKEEESLGDFSDLVPTNAKNTETSVLSSLPPKKSAESSLSALKANEIHASSAAGNADSLSDVSDPQSDNDLRICHPSDMAQFMPESSFSNLNFSHQRMERRGSHDGRPRRSSFSRISSKQSYASLIGNEGSDNNLAFGDNPEQKTKRNEIERRGSKERPLNFSRMPSKQSIACRSGSLLNPLLNDSKNDAEMDSIERQGVHVGRPNCSQMMGNENGDTNSPLDTSVDDSEKQSEMASINDRKANANGNPERSSLGSDSHECPTNLVRTLSDDGKTESKKKKMMGNAKKFFKRSSSKRSKGA